MRDTTIQNIYPNFKKENAIIKIYTSTTIHAYYIEDDNKVKTKIVIIDGIKSGLDYLNRFTEKEEKKIFFS